VPSDSTPCAISTRRKPSAQALKRLYAKAWWTAERDPAGIRAVLKNSDLIATAWIRGELVAFARVSTDFAYRAVLWDVIVDTEHQRRGLGTRLVRAILEDARLAKVESFWLFTTDKQAFYKSFGFKTHPKNVMVWRRHVPARNPAR
jgi:ribosomal protein S18 acetylase RimI-like enzyme